MMSTKTMRPGNIKRQLVALVASPAFFKVTLVSFGLQASWIALSGNFPMAFDEDTHLGIIKFFAQHPNPFFSQQPSSLNVYGAVVHDPSYLYRYLMSFPWRLITQLTGTFTAQVISLRLLNVILFIIGMVLFRKLVLKITSNRALVNLSLLLFALTPITSQLAAQINYDNLLFPLIAGSLLLTLDITARLERDDVNIWRLGWLLILLLLTSLVKYTFLPFVVPISILLIWQFIKLHRRHKKRFVNVLRAGFTALSPLKTVLIITMVILSAGLFFERYGMNIVRYHTPTPSCVDVIGVPACQSYSIYQRSVSYAVEKPDAFNKNPFLFTYRWLKHMHFNLMMSIGGPNIGYATGQPLPLPYIATIIFGALGIIVVIIFYKRLFISPAARLLAAVSLLYTAALWLTNYVEYLSTGRRVAVQGRYLVPLLPFLYLIFLCGFKLLLERLPRLQFGLASLLVVCVLAGGGVSTFILHSDDSWYWPNTVAINTSSELRTIVRHMVPPWDIDYHPVYQSSFDF